LLLIFDDEDDAIITPIFSPTTMANIHNNATPPLMPRLR